MPTRGLPRGGRLLSSNAARDARAVASESAMRFLFASCWVLAYMGHSLVENGPLARKCNLSSMSNVVRFSWPHA